MTLGDEGGQGGLVSKSGLKGECGLQAHGPLEKLPRVEDPAMVQGEPCARSIRCKEQGPELIIVPRGLTQDRFGE